MYIRENALKEWLTDVLQNKEFTLYPLAGDASFRRYLRLECNGTTRVVMDAPPEKENLDSFIYVEKMLAQMGIKVPEILAQNHQQGFLLLSDLGDTLLLEKLHIKTADAYYIEAMKILFKIQECSINDSKLPWFDATFMLKEMNLCVEWFLKARLSLILTEKEQRLITTTMTWIADQIVHQPLVFIHRDYHSRNIMILPSQTQDLQIPSAHSLAIIDFQDAMRGPIAYDLVSLLKDCYISWPREKVLEWVNYFFVNSPHTGNFSTDNFIRAFDLCGIQRHLKVLGVFSRLALRDDKQGYLKDLPMVLNYILECSEIYEELRPFCNFLLTRVYLP